MCITEQCFEMRTQEKPYGQTQLIRIINSGTLGNKEFFKTVQLLSSQVIH
jgi:hypothetical protein